jgi:hypothetical protein
VTSATTTEYPPVTLTSRKILDHINNLRNAEVTEASANEIATTIRTLANQCNARFLKDIQVDAVYTQTNSIQTEIKSWYFSDLNSTNIQKYIIDTFENLERNAYNTQVETSNRCIDALCVLVNYSNIVVQSRTDHYLKLQEKKLDDCSNSSNSVETSTHLVNGECFYGK